MAQINSSLFLFFKVRALEAREDPVEQVERELRQTRSELHRISEELQQSVKVRNSLHGEISQQVKLVIHCVLLC